MAKPKLEAASGMIVATHKEARAKTLGGEGVLPAIGGDANKTVLVVRVLNTEEFFHKPAQKQQLLVAPFPKYHSVGVDTLTSYDGA